MTIKNNILNKGYTHKKRKKTMKIKYPDIYHYCEKCGNNEVHFHRAEILNKNVFECSFCENTINLDDFEEVNFIKYRD